MGSRRRSRELALQTLYALDLGGDGPEALDQAIEDMRMRATEPPNREDEDLKELVRGGPEVQRFAAELVRGVVDHQGSIDEVLSESSTNWKVARMARVDRNILRLATFELRFRDDIPPKVTLNEAVEIAKRYGSKDSGAFVNGILDRIARASHGAPRGPKRG